MIVLPGPIVLADPLPAGWRRPDPAPWRDPAEVAVTVERLAPVAAATDWPVTSSPGIMGGAPCIAGTRVPVSALVEMRRDGWNTGQIQRDGYPHVPLSTIRAALAWADAHVPEAVPPRPVAPAGRWVRRCTARSDCGRPAGHAPPCVPTRSDCTCGPYDPESRCTWCDGLVWQAAAAAVAGPEVDVAAELAPTRSERIEAAARRLVRAQETTYAIEATCGLGEQRSDALRAEARAFDELRAALCTCTAHGPDPACVEHGEALRAWQARHAP